METQRLLLRQWREDDRTPWAKICADPQVMQFLSSARDKATSDAAIDRWMSRIAGQGWSFWAVELKATGQCIGMAGLQVPAEPHPFLPCTEMGWRLAREQWGHGYATEASRRVLRFGFEDLQLHDVVATTAECNANSEAVMRRLGMSGPVASFIHPGVPETCLLKTHVLYRLTKEQWHARGDACCWVEPADHRKP